MERNQTNGQQAKITIKGKTFHVCERDGVLGFAFASQTSRMVVTMETAEISMTMFNGAAYIDTGLMLFGPIDDAAASVICQLITPTIH